jgi:hypothetical protein
MTRPKDRPVRPRIRAQATAEPRRFTQLPTKGGLEMKIDNDQPQLAKAAPAAPTRTPQPTAEGHGESSAPAKSDAHGSSSKASQVAIQALVSSVKNEFAEVGIVPPPRQYAGMRIPQATPTPQAGDSEGEQSTRNDLGSLGQMRLIMVKHILSQLTGQVAADPSAESGVDLNETA